MRFGLCLLLLCSFSSNLLAQFDTGAVLGTVRDKTGAVMPGARITLTNLETGIRAEKNTDENGNYEFFTVRTGRYKVSAEKSGFATAFADGVLVSVNTRQRVDLEMAVGQVAESIEVTDAVRLVETDSSQRGQSVKAKQILELPLNGRAYSSLVLLTTGVRSSLLSTGGATPREGSFNVNGLRSTFNNFLLDGIDNNAYGTSNQGFSNQVMQPPPDALAEFQVVTNNMSAEFGRSGGAAVNVAYRSGTNAFHGSAWEFLRNRELNATGFFKPPGGIKPPLTRNQFGFTFGGPIRKNKIFFFLDYEGFRQVRRQLTTSTMPTLNDRRGVFSLPVRNPLTGTLYPANTPIPVNDITTFARRVLGDLPAPTNPGAGGNFQLLQGFRDFTDKYNTKFDYQINSKISGFTRLGQRKANIFDEPNIPGPSGGDGNGFTRVLNQQLVSGLTYTPSPVQLVEFRFGVSRTRAGKEPIGLGAPTMRDVYGIQGLPTDQRIAGGLTSQLITGYNTIGKQSTNPQWQHPTVFNPKVNYSRFLGKHSVKAGYEFQRIHTEVQDVNPLYGVDRYSANLSKPAANLAASNVYNMADFLFGLRDLYGLVNLLIANYRQNMQFLYLQDDWKLTPKLTLNLGMRYEYATPQWERDQIASNFDPLGLRMIKASSGSLSERALMDPDRNNWAPRLGFAYSIDNRTVVRGGAGVSYIHFNRSGGGNLLAINGPQVVNALVSNPAPVLASGQPNPAFRTTQQGYPEGLTSPDRFNPLLSNITYMPRDTRTGYVASWFFSIQREIARQTLVDVAYVGNRSNKLLLFADYNQGRINRPGEIVPLQQRRPIASFSDITYAFPGGWANYNSLQVRFERRLQQGLFVLNSFTWSKAMDNVSGALEDPLGNGSALMDNYNRGLDKGLSGYNQPITNITSVLWQTPVGKGRRFLSSLPKAGEYLLGGWQISAINSINHGAPITVFHDLGGAYQVSTIGPTWRGRPVFRPNVTGEPFYFPDDRPNRQRFLNPAAFALPANNNPFGTAGRNIGRMPNFFQLDLAAIKDFALPKEGMALQFRAEFFNLTNKTNFQVLGGLPAFANRNSAAFGNFTNTFDPRLIQLALRLTW
ncbi:MAG: TonB-dependent receptor [Acidobacteria bacterium]|nr:TonB-dependent receptor [Acidobacteriota bacterium]